MLRIEKWQGLGNDFIVVEGGDVGAERAISLCDRRRGIGADGVLAIAEEAGAVRMIVRNADGSRPPMCGNGVRCVVGYIAGARALERGEIVVLSDAGERPCEFERIGAADYQVSVAMGQARIDGPIVNPACAGRAFVRVDVGNPHALSFGAFAPGDLDVIGPALDRAFDGGINVELCRVVDARRLEVAVWERGVGRTMACGTGACAVAAAAVAAELSPAGTPIDVVLPGGVLHITVAEPALTIHMCGSARRVFRGVIDDDVSTVG